MPTSAKITLGSGDDPGTPPSGYVYVYHQAGVLRINNSDGQIDLIGGGNVGFQFTQATPNSTWNINHNLNMKPVVGCFTLGGIEIEGDVQHVSLNQTIVQFSTPQAGTARLF